jgi:hypothetical protein
VIYPLFLALQIISARTCDFSGEFTLTTTVSERTADTEVVSGKLYTLEEPSVIFEVLSPIKQLMWVKRDTTEIYYPDEKKFFRIISTDTLLTTNSNVTQLFNFDLEHQLHLIGFKTFKAMYNGDTVFHYWEKENYPKVVTGTIGDDLVIYQTSERGWSLEFSLWDYRNIDGKRYPHSMRSTVKIGKNSRSEELHLEAVQRNQPLPKYLAELTIPTDVEVKVIRLGE